MSECANICDELYEKMCCRSDFPCPHLDYCQNDHIPGDERNHTQMVYCLSANLESLSTKHPGLVFQKTEEDISDEEFEEIERDGEDEE